MYRQHQSGGGPGRLIETVSAEHPTRSARLRPYVPGVRLCFEQITGEIRRELAEWVCAEPAPSVDAIRTKLGYDEGRTYYSSRRNPGGGVPEVTLGFG
jgi:hypothetical protein